MANLQQVIAALRRRDDDRQRRVDRLLTRELQTDLRLKAAEARTEVLACAACSVHAGSRSSHPHVCTQLIESHILAACDPVICPAES